MSTARTTRSDYLLFGRLASGWRTPEGPDATAAASVAKRITDAAESTRASGKGVELPPAAVATQAHALAAYISMSECYTVLSHKDAILSYVTLRKQQRRWLVRDSLLRSYSMWVWPCETWRTT